MKGLIATVVAFLVVVLVAVSWLRERLPEPSVAARLSATVTPTPITLAPGANVVVCPAPASPVPSPTPSPSPSPTPVPTSLINQPPGFATLSDSSAAAIANQALYPEAIPQNVNDGTGYDNNTALFTTPSYFYNNAAPGGLGTKADYANVDGNYSGSTANIERWVAAKYGVDPTWVAAEGQEESKRRQDNPQLHGGTVMNSAGDCNNPDGPGIGMTPNLSFLGYPVTNASGVYIGPNAYNAGCSGGTFASHGILETKDNNFEWFTWPMLVLSTAWNEDYRWAKWRACVNGDYSGWFGGNADYLAAVSRARSNPSGLLSIGVTGPRTLFANETNEQYLAAGCVGAHYSGRWYDAGSACYLGDIGSCASWQATDNFIYILQHHTWVGQ